MDIRYSYRHCPTIKAFADCDAFIRGLMGPFGSGKSSACVVEILRRAMAQQPGPDGIRRTRWAVIRNTFPQLRDTTIKTFHQWAPPALFGEYRSSDTRYLITAFPNTHIEVLFRALDRPDHIANLLSLELTGAWVNEAREIPWPIIDALQGRVGRFPAAQDGGPTWHGIVMDTNPPDVDTKWYRFFEEQEHDLRFARLFKQPSGLGAEAENIPNLIAGYYEKLAQGKDPEWVKVYIHGQYGFVSDGRAIFPEYDDGLHCADCTSVSGVPIYRGWDFGLTPACVFAQLTPRGQLFVIDEIVADDMGVDAFSEEVLSHSSRYYPNSKFVDIGDPAGAQRAQTDEKTCFQILHSKGIWIEPGLQTLAIRFESVRKPLTRLVGGKPAFQLHPRCKMLRRGFQGGYQYRRLQTSGERYSVLPDKNAYSHPMDALQYACTRIFGTGLLYGDEREVDDHDDAEASWRAAFDTRSRTTGY